MQVILLNAVWGNGTSTDTDLFYPKHIRTLSLMDIVNVKQEFYTERTSLNKV